MSQFAIHYPLLEKCAEAAIKVITLHCSCGASISLSDAAEAYINSRDGSPDKKGRRFQIELRADDWLDRHQKCVDIKNQLLLKRPQDLKPRTIIR